MQVQKKACLCFTSLENHRKFEIRGGGGDKIMFFKKMILTSAQKLCQKKGNEGGKETKDGEKSLLR